MSGCSLPPTLTGYYPTSTRTKRRSLVKSSYPATGETYSKLCRCWLVHPTGALLDWWVILPRRKLIVVPVGAVASLLSYDEIKNKLPWLPRLIDRSPRLEALIQTTLPTLAVVTFNGLSPFLLECAYIDYNRGLADGQGYLISKLTPRGQLPSTPYSESE